ncbi:hypothetical protein HNP84_009626 [Thermocatellispora tengchongensis]|uniref:Uncharacterized protein n=1 Tax=Thermocatellispora tengchongensis TaxID=1073253 RepID=A0A840PLA0_9ACTN|nr:hypothetical protein [Thermocatellispora tengchongensis]MBB5139862.1 hypothetical protein [Thermocatellispora tengchongensis]
MTLDHERYNVRNRATWLLGQDARVMFVPTVGEYVEVELLSDQLPPRRRRHRSLHVGGLQVIEPEIPEGKTLRRPRAGDRATIVRLRHSHTWVCAYENQLLGQQGVIVRMCRDHEYAIVELDNPPRALHGVRRWNLHVDDLHIARVEEAAAPAITGTGMTASAGGVMRHATAAGETTVSLCGMRVRPILIAGWSPPFSPDLERSCPACVERIRLPDTCADSR